MADLSPAQLNFLETHMSFSAQGYRKRKQMKSQLQDFWRRREKAESQLADLPPDHPQRPALEKAVADATKKAEGGDLKGAYKDLKDTKATAKAAAKVERDGATVDKIESDLLVLETLIRRLRSEQNRIRDRADQETQALIDESAQLPDAASGRDREEIMERVADNFRAKQGILAEWDELSTEIEQDLRSYQAILANVPTAADLVTAINHNIVLLNQQRPDASRLPHNAQFLAADQLVRTHHLNGNGSELKTEISTKLRNQRQTLLDTLEQQTKPPALEPLLYTDDAGTPLEGQAAEAAAKKMEDQFRHLEKREAERLEAAKKAFREAVLQDNAFLRMTDETNLPNNTRIRPFDTADLMENAGIDITDASVPPDQIAATAGRALREAYDKLMDDAGGVIPDEVFEMCSRSKDEWYVEAAKSAGIAFNPKNVKDLDPAVWAKIKAAGDEMRLTAQDRYPNKAKFDGDSPTEVTVGGVTYKEMKKLGSGGGGVVYRGTDPASGRQIVLKMPLSFKASRAPSADEHETFKAECANHRAVSGGEYDDCPENILDMKGMVLAPNGLPLIAMDLADAGDADDYTEAMGACESSGLMGDGAKKALMAGQMRDMVKGMKALQSAGMTHHDLKEANVFMTGDGTFKVADFGLARHVDSGTDAVRNLEEYTPGYQPPELEGEGDVTQKSDNFTLGEILERITDPYRSRGKYEESFGSLNPGPTQKRTADGRSSKASALDRLINKLKDPDPTKRPTLDAVLQSSFLQDLEDSYTEDDLKRLRTASAQYAKTAGRETADLNREISYTEGAIVKLEMSKSDALTQAKIDHTERLIKLRQSEKRKLEREFSIEFDEKKKEKLDQAIKRVDGNITSADRKLTALQAELGQAKTSLDIEEIDKKIETMRKQVIALRKQIDDIHKKDEYKDVIAELEAANKAFG